jgi:hypothetical protein
VGPCSTSGAWNRQIDAESGAIWCLKLGIGKIAPLAASNGVGDLPRELTYARANGVPGLQLVQGTEPFNADVVGAVIRGLGV